MGVFGRRYWDAITKVFRCSLGSLNGESAESTVIRMNIGDPRLP